MELSTYFRINAEQTGQFERTLIIADKGAYVSYLEGCTRRCATRTSFTPRGRADRARQCEIKYSTVQNWYPGDKEGKGGIYNFVTSARLPGKNSKIFLDAGGDRLGHHLEVSSCILRGDGSRGEFYSIAISNGYQQVDSAPR